MSEFLDVFSAWKLTKALAHRERVQRIAELLADKEASDITFTAIEADGSLSQYVLGSIEGNANFLLGRCNPGFHVAPYHFQVVDPTLTDVEAVYIFHTKGHPALPQFWAAYNQVPFEEGDLKEGTPHPGAFVVPQKDPTFAVTVDGCTYYANPLTQLIQNQRTDHVFAWSLLRNSYLASQAPELTEKMDGFVPGVFDARIEKALPSTIAHLADYYSQYDWPEDAYPLVKSLFPKPGSIVRTVDGYAVVGPAEVFFYDREGTFAPVEIGGTEDPVLYLDPDKSAPNAVLSFARQVLHIDTESLRQTF